MATGGPLPYLKFGDVEIANAARTLSYLRRGLAQTNSGHWVIGPSDVSGVLYRVNGGTCVSPDVFVHPAVDPAPWYDPNEAGSEDFLGVVLLDLEGYDSTIKRAVTQRMGGLGGGTLAAQYRTPRTWKFRGVLVSASDIGAEYGLRWLTAALQTGDCDTCSTGFVTVRLTSPPADCSDDENGKWLSYENGLVEGPLEVESWGPANAREDDDAMGGCRDWVEVTWTMVSGNPFLYKDPVVCLPEQILESCDIMNCTDICTFISGANDAPCCDINPPERGILGAIFTLTSMSTSTSGYGMVQLEARANCTDGVPEQSMTISAVPAGATVVVNCANHTVTVTDANGDVSDGQDLIVLEEGQTVEWIEVAACDPAACVCINGLDSTPGNLLQIEISTQIREG